MNILELEDCIRYYDFFLISTNKENYVCLDENKYCLKNILVTFCKDCFSLYPAYEIINLGNENVFIVYKMFL